MSTPEAVVRPQEADGAQAARRRRLLIAAVGVLLAAFAAGLAPRMLLRKRLEQEARAVREALPRVETVRPEPAPRVLDVPLPATTQPLLVTGVYARTNGYLRTRYVDIGDRVQAGQLLAEIDTPEVDQELSQARATLAESRANVVKLEASLDLTRTTLKRYLAAGVGSVSQQQIDVQRSSVTVAEKTVDAARATVDANLANVDRLTDLQAFQRVYAPFAGVITQRQVDFGSLITAGSTQGTTELFEISQLDPLRIFVYVPQSNAGDVRVGGDVEVRLRELPGRVFHGTVSRTAGAIDPVSRTLLTEVLVANEDGALLSGAYVTVRFQLERDQPPLLIPATALLVGAQGTRVAVIGADGTLTYREVQVGRDYGARIEVLRGLEATDSIATRWPGALADGTRVVATAPAEQPAPAASPSGGRS